MRKKPSSRGRPLIGVTCEVEKSKPRFVQFNLTCDYRYIRAILGAGGTPLLIPLNPDPQQMASLLARLHGLVIVGGADIHPSYYGERASRHVKPMYRGRTDFELRLVRMAKKRRIPVLAICHGMQLLNVLSGGTLYQDIRSQVKDARDHRSRRSPLHRVTVRPGSRLHRILGCTSFFAHSHHHQAVKTPGRSLAVSAVADDGVVEAIEGPPWTIAVQWHPERQPKDPVQRRLFRYFLSLARARMFSRRA